MDFEEYLTQLADHELNDKPGTKEVLKDPRRILLVTAGINLNWLGDFFANKNINWEKKAFKLDQIVLTGMYGELNEILIKKCQRNPRKVQETMAQDGHIKKVVEENASYQDLPIIVRNDEDRMGQKYKVLDGMNRMLGKIVKNTDEFEAYYPTNEFDYLPLCEPHVIYDVIRGYIRHARDEKGRKQLYHALSLLVRTYENTATLLKERFGPKNVFEKDVQKVIIEVLKDN